jgi:parallel beta-helix repeat protein
MNKFLISLFILFLLPSLVSATEYHIDVNNPGGCDDGWLGTESQPWCTLQNAANTMVAEDTAIVHAGTYRGFEQHTSGSPGKLITYKVNPGDTVTIQTVFEIYADYIKIDGFKITDHEVCHRIWGSGIYVEGDYCEIVNNYLYDNYWFGIFLAYSSDNCLVDNNTVSYSSMAGMKITGNNHIISNNDVSHTQACKPECDQPDADGIRFHGSGHIISGNYIHDIKWSEQHGCYPHMDAFQTFDNSPVELAGSNCVFEKNHVYLMEPGIDGGVHHHTFMLEHGANNLIIKNNIFECHDGINTGSGNPDNFDIFVYNNIFRSSLSFPSGTNPVGINIDYVDNMEVKNNIILDFTNNHFVITSRAENITRRNNCIFNSDGSTPGMSGASPDPTDLWMQDAKFVSEFDDLHLQYDSLCVDTGVTIPEVTDDYDGISRPQGAAYDIGAYEYHGSLETCSDLEGTCCTQDEVCQGGLFITSSDCGNRCCVGGGICQPGPTCSDLSCDIGECTSCPGDCTLADCDSNGQCEIGLSDGSENCQTDPVDCACTGNDICCNDQCITPICFQGPDCGSNLCKDYTCSNPGTCSASCSSVDKPCGPSDGCCPSGCTEQDDTDCIFDSCSNIVLLHHYDNDPSFGESSTHVYDFSGLGNNGTVYGGAVWNQTGGKFAGAFEYDGNDDYMYLANPELPEYGPLTISVWFKQDTQGSDQKIISRWDDNGNKFAFLLAISGSGEINCYVRNSVSDDSIYYVNGGSINSGQWHHIAVTIENGTLYLYKDGVQYSGIDAGWDASGTGGSAVIGAKENTGSIIQLFQGTIDEVAIWNRSLSSQEIQDIFNSGSPINCGVVQHHRADTNKDGCISLDELLAFIDRWKHSSKDVPMPELMQAIGLWKSGEGCFK